VSAAVRGHIWGTPIRVNSNLAIIFQKIPTAPATRLCGGRDWGTVATVSDSDTTHPVREEPAAGAAPSFARRVRSAIFWRSGSQIVAQVIAWASTLIVIRLLDPADYGLYAMAQAVFVFLSFLNGYGFASSLIQAEEVTPRALRQAFGILLLLNGSLALVQYFGAPLLADYYGQPIVTDLLRTTALIYLATPFFVIPEVVMARALEFRKQALVNLIAAITGAATALTLALNDYGVWTLVYAPIVLFWTRAIGLTIAARLLVWPSFDLRGTGKMLGFGGAILLTQLLWLIQSQSDIFIAGRSFAPRELGLYAEALFLTQVLMSKFVPPLNEVAFPAYSRIQHDIAALRAGFLKAMRLVGLVTFPAYLGIVATAGPLIETLLGPKWVAMTPLVRIIALSMPVMTLQILFSPATTALGRPRIATQTAGFGAVAFTLAFLVGVQFGPVGLSIAWLAASPALLACTYWLSRRLIGFTLGDIWRSARSGLVPAIAMALIVTGVDLLLVDLVAPLRLALLVAAGMASYAGLLFVYDRPALVDAIATLRGRAA